jgi:putative FmdB family regulatory protein
MPTYDYQCLECGHTFDAFQMMKDKPLRKCPECNGKVKRLLGTGAGLIFKGSGFYETDYKRTSTASSTGQSADTAATVEKPSSDAKTEKPSSTSSSPPAKSDGGDT